MDNELKHHGILGMKWGVRKDPKNYNSSNGGKSKKQIKKEQKDYEQRRAQKIAKERSTPPARTLTTQELIEKNNRLGIEQKYKRLVQDKNAINKGKKMVGKALERAGQNLLDDTASYVEKKLFDQIAKDGKIKGQVINSKGKKKKYNKNRH